MSKIKTLVMQLLVIVQQIHYTLWLGITQLCNAIHHGNRTIHLNKFQVKQKKKMLKSFNLQEIIHVFVIHNCKQVKGGNL
jgi:ABC-type arginine transport system ATPase subunit